MTIPATRERGLCAEAPGAARYVRQPAEGAARSAHTAAMADQVLESSTHASDAIAIAAGALLGLLAYRARR